jgi:hypothetical protein
MVLTTGKALSCVTCVSFAVVAAVLGRKWARLAAFRADKSIRFGRFNASMVRRFFDPLG